MKRRDVNKSGVYFYGTVAVRVIQCSPEVGLRRLPNLGILPRQTMIVCKYIQGCIYGSSPGFPCVPLIDNQLRYP